jgi:hypothetical protein
MKKLLLLISLLFFSANFLIALQLSDRQIVDVSKKIASSCIQIIKNENRTDEFTSLALGFHRRFVEIGDWDDILWGLVCLGAVNNMKGINIDAGINVVLNLDYGSANISDRQRGIIHTTIGDMIYQNVDLVKSKWKIVMKREIFFVRTFKT